MSPRICRPLTSSTALILLGACTSGPCKPPGPPPQLILPVDVPPTAKVEVWRSMVDDEAAPRRPGDGGGAVVLVQQPDPPVRVGELGTWRFRFTVGEHGIALGGAIVFQPPPFWGWSPAQVLGPDQPGFVDVSSKLEPGQLELIAVGTGVALRVTGKALPPGTQVDLTYGAGLGAVADTYAESAETFGFAVDGDGDGIRSWVSGLPTTRVRPGDAVGLWVTAPTTARPGESFEVTVAALDRVGNLAEHDADLQLVVEGELETGEVPGLVAGTARIRVTAPRTGVMRVGARTGGGLQGLSGAIVVHPEAPTVLWADLQVHTAASDGTGSLDEVYRYARDVAGLDAVAITDHDHWGVRFLDRRPRDWGRMVARAEAWNRPGSFVAFAAYEWTNWLYGHRHVLYVGEAGPVWSSLDVATRTVPGLYGALREHDAIVIAHHSAGGPVATDWNQAPDPHLEPVTEIVSVHGSSESADSPGRIYSYVEGNSVRDALARGYRLGFIGSTDGHDGHPGLGQLRAPSGGLAALLTEDRTRAGVAAALRARRSYATNGARLLLRFRSGEAEQGSVLPVPPGPVAVEVRVVAASNVRSVELIADGQVRERISPQSSAVRHLFEVGSISEGSWAYVRVMLDDGGVAWSSPLWFADDP